MYNVIYMFCLNEPETAIEKVLVYRKMAYRAFKLSNVDTLFIPSIVSIASLNYSHRLATKSGIVFH